MNKKIIGFFVITLLITSVLPAVGEMGEIINEKSIETSLYCKSLKLIKTRCSVRELLYPNNDTFIDEFANSSNYGSKPHLIVRRGGSGFTLDTIVKFDFSSLSSGTTIISATLKFYYYHWNDGDPVDKHLNIHRITSIWDENITTWDTKPTYTPLVTNSSIVPSSYGWMYWNVTSDVQDFVDGTETNYGWQIIDSSSSGFFSMIYFHSKEYSDSDYCPYLEIEMEEPNESPAAPTINGQTTGNTGTSYTYTFNATDPDGDNVRYIIDWGDNTSNTTGYNPSGTDVTLNHIWSNDGTYNITAKAQDIYGLEGPEGKLTVTMPRNKPSNYKFHLLERFLERFPNVFPIIRYLLGFQ